MPLLDDEKLKRLRGIANSLRGKYRLTREELEDAVQETVRKVEELYDTLTRFDSAWAREVLENIVIDGLRKGGRFVGERDREEDGPLPPRHFEEGKAPLCVVETRLRLLYAQSHNKAHKSEAHELTAYAYWSSLGWSPGQIVESLGELTLGEAASHFLERYALESRIPAARLPEVFPDLCAVIDSPAAKVVLRNHWRPVDLMEEWVLKIAELVPEGPPFDWSEVEATAPYKRIIYLLNRHLGMGFPQIIAVHGTDPLGSIFVRFEEQYMSRNNLSRDEVRDRFGPMLGYAHKSGNGRPNQYYSSSGAVSDWIDTIRKKLGTRLDRQEELGVKQIFTAAGRPYKSYRFIVFIENFILKADYKDLLVRYSPLGHQEAVDMLIDRYTEALMGRFVDTGKGRRKPVKKEEREKDEAKLRDRLKKAREQLRKKLIKWFDLTREESVTLGFAEAVECDRRPEESSRETVARWRHEVFSNLKGKFGCHDPETVIFAWFSGFLAPIKESRER